MQSFELPLGPLGGRHVRLEPFAPELKPEVRAALDCDPEAWSVFLTAAHGPHFDVWWARAQEDQAAGRRVAFAVRRLSDDTVIGTSSLSILNPHHRVVELGSTFYSPDARGGPVNPACKHALLEAAFDAGALRVELVTDARNLRSQAALAKLGAVREGVLRRHRITWTGHVRDTVVFAITDQDWPRVRAGLEARLAEFG